MSNNIENAPRGNTQKNVNKNIFEYLLTRIVTQKSFKWLDIPCGAGEFLTFAHQIFPNAILNGVDIMPMSEKPTFITFKQANLSKDAPTFDDEKFDLITSVSGIMMFGNTQFFLENTCKYLKESGLIIVSNDNCFTIRDRLSYFFLGRLRRFNLLFGKDEGLTQFVPQQEIYRLLDKNEITVKEVVYTSFYAEDLLFLPFLLLVLPFQYFYLWKLKSHISKKLRFQMFGWKSLIFRHYFFIGEKTK